MRIGALDTEERVVVVAEIGNNHEGDFGRAQELVRAAADAGADAVKTQVFRTEAFTSAADEERFARLKSFELPHEQHVALGELARSLGLAFVATPLDLGSADVLREVVDAYKVASGDVGFYALLERVAASGKPVIVSSGGADLEQLRRTVAFVHGHGGAGRLAVLHCVSAYPPEPDQANLRSIPFLAEQLDAVIGYSDHVVGPTAALAAVALGARIVEKHFTLDKQLSAFRDHALSADPDELRRLVREIRELEPMLGDYDKRVQPGEAADVVKIRRSAAAARDLARGHVVREDDLLWIRPGGGVEPGSERVLLGRALRRDVARGEQLAVGDVD